MIRATIALLAIVSGCQQDETVAAYGPVDVTWQLSSLNGAPFNARANITFTEGGNFSGQAPCNSFSSASSLPYPWFEAGPILASKAACPELAEETAFFKALSSMSRAIFDNGQLAMANDEGGEMVFTASE
ncbi:META domain-containing protein [Tateyamaria sp.]|uniref:META domain-containing protein n=1 Tax=Tateyamaria sp. TaxID=1929288 RepID=UPI00329DF532